MFLLFAILLILSFPFLMGRESSFKLLAALLAVVLILAMLPPAGPDPTAGLGPGAILAGAAP